MNILFHSWEFPPNGAGVGAYMGHMAQTLVQAGHHVVVVTGRAAGMPAEERTDCGHIYRVYDRDDAGSRQVTDRVLAEARNHGINVIEGADHLGECANLLAQKPRPPILIKAHACQVIKVLQRAHVHYPWQRITWALARARARKQLQRERYVIEHADLELVSSHRLLDEMRKQGLRLPARIAVLPNPIADPGCGERHAAETPTILFVGRLEFLKGVQFLPNILRRVLERVPNAQLRVVGGDTYARWVGSLKAWLSNKLGDMAPRVALLGSLTPETLDAEYRAAWVTVAPSLWDNFPTVVLESLIRGLPVVTTPHGGMPEMLTETGATVHDPRSPSFADAVADLLLSEEKRQQWGDAGRQRCLDQYSPAVVGDQYLDFLNANL